MKLKYVGHKARLPVDFPIGVKTLGARKHTIFADPFIEMSEEDAQKLLALSPDKFIIVDEEQFDEMNRPVKKRGRPKKAVAEESANEVMEANVDGLDAQSDAN